ncbi:MAG TPA: hydroxymethylbilane synthase [Thermoanaerobaculia bacterium]|nr:hydroxymethylbilane synthase [Thermoanaerobaculia bacterium]
MTRIRIGTRGSQLALWQANETSRRLRDAGYDPELVIVKTTGDKRHDVSLATIGGKGLFIKELEEALERREIDIAVHSLKDVPSIIPEHFVLAGFLERADPRDAWIHVDGKPITDMPAGAVIGTSAPRRRAQLIEKFPHLKIEPIRGNVETRIAKAKSGQYAGVILASAGLTRLGRAGEITSYFPVDAMLPAAGQGIVGIECLADSVLGRAAAAAIDHPPSAVAARVERGVLQKFGERLDCYSAVAVHCTSAADGLTVRAFISDYEATRAIGAQRRGSNADQLVSAVFDDLVVQGAEELLCVSKKP